VQVVAKDAYGNLLDSQNNQAYCLVAGVVGESTACVAAEVDAWDFKAQLLTPSGMSSVLHLGPQKPVYDGAGVYNFSYLPNEMDAAGNIRPGAYTFSVTVMSASVVTTLASHTFNLTVGSIVAENTQIDTVAQNGSIPLILPEGGLPSSSNQIRAGETYRSIITLRDRYLNVYAGQADLSSRIACSTHNTTGIGGDRNAAVEAYLNDPNSGHYQLKWTPLAPNTAIGEHEIRVTYDDEPIRSGSGYPFLRTVSYGEPDISHFLTSATTSVQNISADESITWTVTVRDMHDNTITKSSMEHSTVTITRDSQSDLYFDGMTSRWSNCRGVTIATPTSAGSVTMTSRSPPVTVNCAGTAHCRAQCVCREDGCCN
jgi:hypothetical protein